MVGVVAGVGGNPHSDIQPPSSNSPPTPRVVLEIPNLKITTGYLVWRGVITSASQKIHVYLFGPFCDLTLPTIS